MKKLYIFLFLITFSFFAKSQNDFRILSSFCQGSANNCASVALIKAAMYKYGYNQMFTSQKKGNEYNIILKNGVNLVISQDELNSAQYYSNFDTTGSAKLLGALKDSVLFYAYLTYAVIAKNISENGYWGCSDEEGNSSHIDKIKGFQNALIFITKTSYCTDNCYRLLGFKIKDNKIFDYNGGDLTDKGTILYSWGHAVAIYNNQLDCYGEWQPVTASKVCFNHFKWYITLQ